eukprot:7080155-Alexandrium_andersonii.AAC.1
MPSPLDHACDHGVIMPIRTHERMRSQTHGCDRCTDACTHARRLTVRKNVRQGRAYQVVS